MRHAHCGMPSASKGRNERKKALEDRCCAHAHRPVPTSVQCIAGTLPSSWGLGGSFPMLSNLTLTNNNLSGSLPMSWGTNSAHIPRFKHLQGLALLPGALLSVVPVMRAAQSLMQRHPG